MVRFLRIGRVFNRGNRTPRWSESSASSRIWADAASNKIRYDSHFSIEMPASLK